MNDPGGNLDVIDGRQFAFRPEENLHQSLEWQEACIEVNLQRANARCEIDDAENRVTFEPGLQRVHAHAESDVEDQIAVLDEQICVAGAPIDDGGGVWAGWSLMEDGWFDGGSW